MMNWLRSAPAGAVLAWSILATAPAVLSAQQPEPTITLEEAVERALQASPTMVQRQGAVRTAGSAERVAWGDFIPSLSMSSGASRGSTTRYSQETNTTITSPSATSYSARISSSVDLFTGGRRLAQMRQVRAQTDAAEVALLEQRFAVALQAKRAFFEVLRNDDLTRVAQERIERAERNLEVAIRRMQVGSGTRSDSLRSQLEVTQARQSLLQAQTNRRAAAFTLGALVGYNGPVSAVPGEEMVTAGLAMTDEELLSIVLEQSPAVQTAETTLRANQAALSSARGQYFPSLSLSGSYSWNNNEVRLSTGNTSWSTSIGLSYPIFNGFSREDANERASVNVTVSRAQLEDARRQARANLDRILATLRLGEQQVELAEEALRVAREDLRVVESRYALGAATILDQIVSQIAVTEAEINLIAARYDYQIARAELEALVGREL